MPRVTAYERYLLREIGTKIPIKKSGQRRPGLWSLSRLCLSTTSIRQRFDAFNYLHTLLEKNPQSLGIAVRAANIATKGHKWPTDRQLKEFNARVGNLLTVNALNEKIGKGTKINPEIVLLPNFRAELNKEFGKIFKSRFGVERIGIRLKPDTLSSIFEYYAQTSKWTGEYHLKQDSYEAMVKAFVEKGPRGIIGLKFSQRNVPEPIFNFLKKLHTLKAKPRAATAGQVNLFKDVFSLQLQNFEQHARQEGLSAARTRAQSTQEMKKIAGNVLALLKNEKLEAPKSVDKRRFADLLHKAQMAELKHVCDALRSTPDSSLTRKQRAFKNAVVGQLGKYINFFNVSEGLQFFEALKPHIAALQNLGPEAQMRKVSELRRQHGVEKLHYFADLFYSIGRKPGNLAANDIANMLKTLAEAQLKRAVGKPSEIEARITYDLNNIFKSGEFGKNCLRAGQLGYPLIGSTLDPHEFFLGYFRRGEYIGFSLTHLMQKGKGFVLFIENPYANETAFTGQMRDSGNNFASTARQAIRGDGIRNLEVQTSWSTASKQGLTALRPIHADKYYDVLGQSVH